MKLIKDLEIITAKKDKTKKEIAKELDIPYQAFLSGLSFYKNHIPKIEKYIKENK